MEFISRNLSANYYFIKHNGLKIYIHENDITAVTIDRIKENCNAKNLTWKLYSRIYYLRGHRKKVDYKQVLFGALEAGKSLPKSLWEVIHCLAFWNQDGIECHRMNAEPDETYRDFILRCMACDCRVFVEASGDQFITGTGGNHIWIADKLTGQRILIFHFLEDLEGGYDEKK